MTINFPSIRVLHPQPKPTDPIQIFGESVVADDNINDLWLAQGDALRKWNENRTLKDVAVVLNTGAGKTLVGLLIAQSLVNETQRQVVYACSSIQLVEQTAEKAAGYGLPTTTYYNRKFSNNLYNTAEAPCVTTYQALFNGKSRFRNDDIAAVIFDDAHTAENILRDQFSVHIPRSGMEETYQRITTLFRPYHNAVGLAMSYDEALDEQSSRIFWVPPFEVQENLLELRRILLDANLGQSTSTMFSWEHIRDKEDLCCLMISRSEVTLAPPTVPASTLTYFRPGVRRVYLSATLSAPDAFARAFGREPDLIVSQSTAAGECERMILVPSVVEGVEDDVASAKGIISDKKALILTPSFARGSKWSDMSNLPSRREVPVAVSAFRTASPPEKLTLAARYDGIDLPGDTCRVLVIDDLPTALSPLERFQWDLLHMENSFRSTLASRIVQSFGRISRGMSDHGVVIVTRHELVKWLQLPRNQALLPEFLRKQIRLGLTLSQAASSAEELSAYADACLGRVKAWIDSYNENMRGPAPVSGPAASDLEKSCAVALAEAKFVEALWTRDFQKAVLILQDVLEKGFDLSQSTGAWLSFWLGFASEMSGADDIAREYYARSHATQPNMPRKKPTATDTGTSLPEQVANVQEQMRVGHPHPSAVAIPKTLTSDIAALSGMGTVPQTEEALRCLGQYLGLESIRPDKEFGTGPDVLWIGTEGYAVCMELKTDKEETSQYFKKDVSQLHDHIQWVKDNHDISQILPVLVGPVLQVHREANPSADMRVVELKDFDNLGNILTRALQDAAGQTIPLGLGIELFQTMSNRGLLFPEVLKKLPMYPLSKTPV